MAKETDYSRKREIEHQRTWATQEIGRLQLAGFFGKITFTFESGKIIRNVTEESRVPPPLDSGKSIQLNELPKL